MGNRVNKWIDFVDRTAWTFIIALCSAFIVVGFNDWKEAVAMAGIAAVGTGGKVTVAQNVGSSGLGDAVPGASVVKE